MEDQELAAKAPRPQRLRRRPHLVPDTREHGFIESLAPLREGVARGRLAQCGRAPAWQTPRLSMSASKTMSRSRSSGRDASSHPLNRSAGIALGCLSRRRAADTPCPPCLQDFPAHTDRAMLAAAAYRARAHPSERPCRQPSVTPQRPAHFSAAVPRPCHYLQIPAEPGIPQASSAPNPHHAAAQFLSPRRRTTRR